MPAKTHTMHGRDHCPGGADPIPCLPPGLGGVPLEYAAYVQSFSSLVGYWRLGETGTPWEDTNPNGYGPNDMTLAGSGTALTADVTGGLPAGQDDGAVRFNYDGSGVYSSGGELIRAATGTSMFNLLTNMTVAAFVKTSTSAASRRGDIVSNNIQNLGGTQLGWGLEIVYPSRVAQFRRETVLATSPGSLIADTWYHVAATYDSADMKLYLNGALVDTTAEPSGVAVGVGSEPLRIGGGHNTLPSWLLGTVDEAAVFNTALTAGEIATLASVLDDPAVEAGKVLTSDGTGGSSWEYADTISLADEAVTPAKIEPGTDGYAMQTVAGAVVWAPPTVTVNY